MEAKKTKYLIIYIFYLLILFLITSCQRNIAQNDLVEPKATPTQIIKSEKVPEISCSPILIQPTPGSDEASIFPEVTAGDHQRGGLNTDITLIEYADFQCPGCAALENILVQLQQQFPDELLFVYRQFPLYDIHDKAFLAAQAAETAGISGKFWEMHDLLFNKYDEWNSFSPDEFIPWLVDKAAEMGLDRENFQATMLSPEIELVIHQNLVDALKTGLQSTPFILINGQIYSGPLDNQSLEQIIKLILLGKRQFSACPEMKIDTKKQYIAVLKTDMGDVSIQLFADKTPISVNSFIFLARNGWFEGNPFFLVRPGKIVQTGDPSGTGFGTPGYILDNEFSPDLNFNSAGVVALENFGSNNNGSQFFITLSPQPELNGNYTIIGKVIEGMEILIQLPTRDPEYGIYPLQENIVISIDIIEN